MLLPGLIADQLTYAATMNMPIFKWSQSISLPKQEQSGQTGFQTAHFKHIHAKRPSWSKCVNTSTTVVFHKPSVWSNPGLEPDSFVLEWTLGEAIVQISLSVPWISSFWAEKFASPLNASIPKGGIYKLWLIHKYKQVYVDVHNPVATLRYVNTAGSCCSLAPNLWGNIQNRKSSLVLPQLRITPSLVRDRWRFPPVIHFSVSVRELWLFPWQYSGVFSQTCWSASGFRVTPNQRTIPGEKTGEETRKPNSATWRFIGQPEAEMGQPYSFKCSLTGGKDSLQ